MCLLLRGFFLVVLVFVGFFFFFICLVFNRLRSFSELAKACWDQTLIGFKLAQLAVFYFSKDNAFTSW